MIILNRNKQKRGNGRGFSAIQWQENDLNRLRAIKEEMEKYKSGHKEWKWTLDSTQKNHFATDSKLVI